MLRKESEVGEQFFLIHFSYVLFIFPTLVILIVIDM